MMKRAVCVPFAVVLIIGSLAFGGCSSKKSSESGSSSMVQYKKPATRKVKVGDIDVAYRVHGKGYPLVMVMGYGGTQDIWDPTVLDLLSKHYKVITFDNRGMGGTTEGTKPFTIKQFADDTAGFMDALGISTAQVLGWSMGTYISQDLALNYPQKVNKLVLYAADCGGPQTVQPTPDVLRKLTDTSGSPQQRGERLFGILFPGSWIGQKKNADYVKKLMSTATEPTSAESVNKQSQAMDQWFQTGVYNQLPNIKSLTMLLTGTDDTLTPPQNSLIMVERIPNAWLSQLRGGGHGVQFQYPVEFSKVVLDFLAAP